MHEEIDGLGRLMAQGRLSRREFLGRTAAFGVSAALATTLASRALAETPVKGGVLRAGMQGGAATDSLDPAAWSSQVPYFFGRQWGEQLVQMSPEGDVKPALAEEWGASDDAKVWTFKIRKGVQFHNGKEMSPADVVATMERHSDANSKSGALGIMGGIASVKADGQTVVFTLKDANADLPFLLDDYHLMIQPNGGKDNPTEGVGTGPYKVTVNEAGVRLGGEKFANYWRDDRGFADQIEIIIINDATAAPRPCRGLGRMINRIEPNRGPHQACRASPSRTSLAKATLRPLMRATAPFDNNDLRLAQKFAIDREEMQKNPDGLRHGRQHMPINKAYPLFTEMGSANIRTRPLPLQVGAQWLGVAAHSDFASPARSMPPAQ
jgi:peptide/nickel transport system substrate-binding protein